MTTYQIFTIAFLITILFTLVIIGTLQLVILSQMMKKP